MERKPAPYFTRSGFCTLPIITLYTSLAAAVILSLLFVHVEDDERRIRSAAASESCSRTIGSRIVDWWVQRSTRGNQPIGPGPGPKSLHTLLRSGSLYSYPNSVVN